VDLGRFMRWYSQSGTPSLKASGDWDAAGGRYTVRLTQSNPDPDSGEARDPLHIPVVVGLLGSDGRHLPLQVEGVEPSRRGESCVLELVERESDFTFTGLKERPAISLLRDFSAPVRLQMERDGDELAFLMGHDSDAFNRWDAGQEFGMRLLHGLAEDAAAGRSLELDSLFSESFGKILEDESLDGSLKALALTLPSERVLGQELATVDVDGLHSAREFGIRTLAEAHRARLLEIYVELYAAGKARSDDHSDATAIAARRLKNLTLAYLASLGEPETTRLVDEQFRTADNMTDSQTALALLVDLPGPERDQALLDFYERWKSDPLVLDKWFTVQAISKLPDTLTRVLELAEHPDFSVKNPNRLRSLVGSFAAGNQVRFHAPDGGGYRFLASVVLEVDALNPQMGARMVSQFNQWKRFDPKRQGLMRRELEGIASQPGISKDVYEIVNRALDR
jgi:aminopeptidase N